MTIYLAQAAYISVATCNYTGVCMRLIPTYKQVLCVVFAFCFSGVMAGCAILNEGAVDYRKSKTVPAAQGGKVLSILELEEKNVYPSDPSSVIDYTKKDSVAVFLQSAFIKEFVEFPALLTKGEIHSRGEIAVIVYVFELGEGKDFTYSPGDFQKGRLVYFNDDVRKGQFLNFNYLPIYGPQEYTGKSLGIEITVMELDAESTALKSLLGTLAGMGKVAYPPSSALLDVMNKLGGALLSGSHDDRIFKYYMTLNPAGGNVNVKYPILSEGHYVFLRKEDRRSASDWGGLAFNQDSGRLVVGGTQAAPSGKSSRLEKQLSLAQSQDGDYRGDSYLVFQVRRNMPLNSYDLQAHNSYEEFRKKYEAAQTAGKIGDIQNAVQAFAQETVSRKTFEGLRAAFLNAVYLPAQFANVRESQFSQFILNTRRAAKCLESATAGQAPVIASGCVSSEDMEKLCLIVQNFIPAMDKKQVVTVESFKKAGKEADILGALKTIPQYDLPKATQVSEQVPSSTDVK